MANPWAYGKLFMDSSGNLYGTTCNGGVNNLGTVFVLDGSSNLTVLHSFSGTDGAGPSAGLIMDSSGNLYGTTCNGGVNNLGTVFKLDGSGNLTVLHSFSGTDGAGPSAGLIMDSSGNLYSTTASGGAYDYGTVFKLDPSGNLTVLHSFNYVKTDGVHPMTGLIMDSSGNLYGTNDDSVFKLETNGNLIYLHYFPSSLPESGGLIMDGSGNFYDTSLTDGAYGYGTVFELTLGVAVNGACGSANGQSLTSAPSGSGLCNSGTASAVSGSGPWTWSCASTNGGTTANYSANIQPTGHSVYVSDLQWVSATTC
jgi:uncharacterized repeat protein (TIGR03803 family)